MRRAAVEEESEALRTELGRLLRTADNLGVMYSRKYGRVMEV